MEALILPDKGTKMLYQSLPLYSISPTKFSVFASSLSHNLGRSYASSSPAQDMGYISFSFVV